MVVSSNIGWLWVICVSYIKLYVFPIEHSLSFVKKHVSNKHAEGGSLDVFFNSFSTDMQQVFKMLHYKTEKVICNWKTKRHDWFNQLISHSIADLDKNGSKGVMWHAWQAVFSIDWTWCSPYQQRGCAFKSCNML